MYNHFSMVLIGQVDEQTPKLRITSVMPVELKLESEIAKPYPKLRIHISEFYYKHSTSLGL